MEACAARGVTGFRVIDAIVGALAQAVPDRIRAPGEGGTTSYSIAGYDRITSTPLPRLSVTAKPALTIAQRRRPTAKRALAVRGMMECVTWSFMPRRFAVLFGGGGDELQLANPISSELDAMRPSILGNLILAVGRNVDRGHDDVAINCHRQRHTVVVVRVVSHEVDSAGNNGHHIRAQSQMVLK